MESRRNDHARLIFPLGLFFVGAVAIGFSLGRHVPWLYDFGWVKGVWIGTWLTLFGLGYLVRTIGRI